MTPAQWEWYVEGLPPELRPLARGAGNPESLSKLLPVEVRSPATEAEVEHARQAEARDRVLAQLSPETSARYTRATQVQNAVALYREALIAPAPTGPKGEPLQGEHLQRHVKYREEIEARIDAVWAALFGHQGDQAKRVLLMQAVDVAAGPGGYAAMVLAQLATVAPELAAKLAPHADSIDALLVAWPREDAGSRKGKWGSLAELWRDATGEKTEPGAWKKAWFRWTRPTREPPATQK
jgi:hypothetical protein